MRYIFPPECLKKLTGREHQVAVLLEQGKTTTEIAETLGIGIRAVQKTAQRIEEKAGLRQPAGSTQRNGTTRKELENSSLQSPGAEHAHRQGRGGQPTWNDSPHTSAAEGVRARNRPNHGVSRVRSNIIQPGSEAARLMERFQHDPTFFSLQFRRYALREQKQELLSQISAGQSGEPKFLFKQRAKSIKVQAASGSKYRSVIRLNAHERKANSEFLERHGLTPSDTGYDAEGKPYYLYILTNGQLGMLGSVFTL